MNKWVLVSLLVVAACAFPPEARAGETFPAVEEVPVGPQSAPADDYRRIAEALLQASPHEEGKPPAFLSYIGNEAGVQIVAAAFQAYVPEGHATQIADFFEAPAARAGVGVFGNWLLTGQFLKNPVPPELDSTWTSFRETAAGVKLFSECYNIYKKIAVDSFKLGGYGVAKAIKSDIGKDAAGQIFGALLKTGVFLK